MCTLCTLYIDIASYYHVWRTLLKETFIFTAELQIILESIAMYKKSCMINLDNFCCSQASILAVAQQNLKHPFAKGVQTNFSRLNNQLVSFWNETVVQAANKVKNYLVSTLYLRFIATST